MKWNRWKRLKQKKGATLAELCVVMALVAIIGTSIVSFSALVQRRTNTSVQNGAVLEDLSNVEMTLKQWIMHFDNADFVFDITNNGNTLVAKNKNNNNEIESTIGLNADKTMLVSDGLVSLQVSMLKGLQFEMRKSKSGRTLVRCTVQYHTAESDDVKNAWLMFTAHAQDATLTR